MTYQELLNRLTELDWLATPAPDGEKSGCMSSYDRASAIDPATGEYVHWDANDDGTGCIRRLDDGGIVAFESEGPGVIWRIWSALPQAGHIRIYIDGEETPVVDAPFIDWFEKQPGDVPPLNLSELSMRLSRGRVSYIPVPYQKSCRVVLAEGWGSYYHFTYTRFAPGTRTPRYEERFTREGMIALARADRSLYERGERERASAVCASADILPGQTAVVLERPDAGLIEELALTFPGRTLPPEALQALVLRAYWDGRARPAIEAPLGEFFGGAPGYARYRCLPMSMERGGFYCRFPMPFSNGCRIEVANTGESARHIDMRFALATPGAPVSGLLRFHAKYHRGANMPQDAARFAPGGDRWPDWPLLRVRNGRGRFCGVHLHVLDTWREPAEKARAWWYGVWDKKTVDWWWGEGDEKFFVDGERFPSTFGTGSEDYIGYAWAAEPPFARFDSPYSCLNEMPIDGNGHTGVCRFQIPDSVPFNSSFEGFIEKYKPDVWGDGNACLYAATPYWYQQADTDDEYPPLRPD